MSEEPSESVPDEITPVPQPHRTRSKMVDDGERMLVTFQNRQIILVGFLLFWLSGWSVGCVFLIGMVIDEPKFFNFCFAVPFWASWFLVVGTIIYNIFNKQWVMLGPDGLMYQVKVIKAIKTKSIPLSELLSFRSYEEESGSGSSHRIVWGVEADALGHNLRMLEGLGLEETEWLADQLQRRLKELHASYGEPQLPEDYKGVQPPSDSRWELIEEGDRFLVSTDVAWKWSSVGGLLFLNLFWNGIVSVFLYVLIFSPDDVDGADMGMGGKICMGLFLLPFVAIGSLFVFGLIAELTTPFQRWRHAVDHHELMTVASIFGFRFIKRLPVHERIDETRIMKIEQNEPTGKRRRKRSGKPGADYYFMIRKPDGDHKIEYIRNHEVVFEIAPLTEGEANWLDGLIKDRRPEWFVG